MTLKKVPPTIADHPAISQWFRFDTEGRVDMRSGKVEIGQGINTAFVQIAADELDIDPARIDLTAGDTRSTPDEGMTAGSRSMEAGGTAVRLAASAARHALLAEAAKLLQASAGDLTVVDGQIHVSGRESDLTYWSLAGSVDLGQEIAEHAAPKKPDERRLAGTSFKRLDLPGKLRGEPSYIQDLEIDGMLHGRIIRPPAPSSRLEKVDEAAIGDLPGVIEVVRDGSFLALITGREDDAIRAAERAQRHCTWSSPGDAPVDPVAAVGATKAEAEVSHNRGDVDAAEGTRISTEVTRPYLSHGSIGPSCAIAEWQNGRLILRTHSQGVFPLRKSLAKVFEMDIDAIDVIHVPSAGCYGHNGADDVAFDAARTARAVEGKPVRMQWSRADEFCRAPLAPAMVVRAEATVDGDGRMSAFAIDIKSPPHNTRPAGGKGENLVGATHLAKPFTIVANQEQTIATGGASDRNSVPLYTIENLRTTKHLIHDLPWRTSAMRGLGAFMNVFAIETLMDDVADELGRDPLEYRLAHTEDERIRAVLEKAAEMAGWPGEVGTGSALGLAFSRYKNSGAYCAVVTRVELDEDIRVTHAWSAADAGEAVNPDGIANQIEGGMVQATSWTLKEAIGFDGETVETTDWESYPILSFAEVPLTEVEVIARPDLPPLGVGEASQGPTGAAISNAVKRGVGARIRALPITRDAVVSALS